ncbi:hypothetical protein SDC9_180203 [bioreactor metagenome]|uniref:Uncharacterized protein n=1 Tax=bioreactor metagenome TaxID=1076179 RepID=A0A645HAA6_9ZZZZ
MLRRIKPKAIICYSDPFPEMQGNIITIDYAETNHLRESQKYWTFPEDNSCFKFGPTQLPETPTEINSHYMMYPSIYTITAGMGGGESRGSGRIGGRSRMRRNRGNTPRDNKRQNKQTDSVASKLKLTQKQQRELHDLCYIITV